MKIHYRASDGAPNLCGHPVREDWTLSASSTTCEACRRILNDQYQSRSAEPERASHSTEPERIDHPAHYNSHPSGVETITICETMGFNLGNAIKYLMRADYKGQKIDDLKKAAWYVAREIERVQKEEK